VFEKIISIIEKVSAIAGAFSKVSKSLIETTKIAKNEYENITNSFKQSENNNQNNNSNILENERQSNKVNEE